MTSIIGNNSGSPKILFPSYITVVVNKAFQKAYNLMLYIYIDGIKNKYRNKKYFESMYNWGTMEGMLKV